MIRDDPAIAELGVEYAPQPCAYQEPGKPYLR